MSIPRLLNRSRRCTLTRLVLVALAQAGVSVVMALQVQYAFDHWFGATAGTAPLPAVAIGAGLLLAGAGAAWLRLRERVEAERLGQSYAYSVRMALYDHLGDLDPRTLQGRSRGGNLLRFIGDLTALRQWVSQGLVRLLVVSVTATGAVTALACINLRLSVGVAAVMLIGASLALLTGTHMQRAVRETRRRRARLAANVNEQIATMSVVQVFDQVRRERARLARQSRSLRDAMIERARVIGQLRAITEGTGAAAMALTLSIGAREFSQGRATAGTVAAAITVLGMLMPALRDLGRVHEYWHGYCVAREKIDGFLAVRPQVRQTRSATDLAADRGHIELRNVSVDGIIADLSAQARPGSVVTICGPNGSGKSTLLNLVARLLDPDRGQVLIDGQDLACLTLSSIRRVVGVVSPDLPLMRGSIERNLRYRWPGAPEEELRRVCRLCGVDTLLEELPDGTRTRVVDGGANLSLGQRQRLSLARALLGNPCILLLDETDANLDTASRRALDRVLAQYRGTVLFVTHRRERIAAADVVWHIEDGTFKPIHDRDRGMTDERYAA